jgi:hypothetical protein
MIRTITNVFQNYATSDGQIGMRLDVMFSCGHIIYGYDKTRPLVGRRRTCPECKDEARARGGDAS